MEEEEEKKIQNKVIKCYREKMGSLIRRSQGLLGHYIKLSVSFVPKELGKMAIQQHSKPS